VAEATEAQLAFAERRREHEALRVDIHRRIMEWLEVPPLCRRKSCRRAGKCTSPTVACFDEARPFLQEHVFPDLLKALRARVGGGER
jgi:hypothetical protein